MNLNRNTLKSARAKFSDKLITILVSEFTNVFTEPDGEFMIQDDDPSTNCQPSGDDEEDS